MGSDGKPTFQHPSVKSARTVQPRFCAALRGSGGTEADVCSPVGPGKGVPLLLDGRGPQQQSKPPQTKFFTYAGNKIWSRSKWGRV